jgi:hypothetical protein
MVENPPPNSASCGWVRRIAGVAACSWFGDALDFTGAEFISWCREVGFRKFGIIPLDGPSRAAIACK